MIVPKPNATTSSPFCLCLWLNIVPLFYTQVADSLRTLSSLSTKESQGILQLHVTKALQIHRVIGSASFQKDIQNFVYALFQ